MDIECQAKWDRASRTYDWMTWAEERRFGPAKLVLFAQMTGPLPDGGSRDRN